MFLKSFCSDLVAVLQCFYNYLIVVLLRFDETEVHGYYSPKTTVTSICNAFSLSWYRSVATTDHDCVLLFMVMQRCNDLAMILD